MTKALVLSLYTLILLTDTSFASNIEKEISCNTKSYDCVKSVFDERVAGKNSLSIDNLIELIKTSDGEAALKDNLLGVAYLQKKTPKANKISKCFLKRALEQGVYAAATNLAEISFREKKYEESMLYLRVGKEQQFSYPDEKYIIWARVYARNLFYSPLSNKKDKAEAVKISEQIAKYDLTGASQYILGIDFLQKKQPLVALEWFRLADDYGHIHSLVQIGFIYYAGNGVKRDIETAKLYFKQASNKGSGEASFNLAAIALEEQNHQDAQHYLELSAEQGFPKALDLLQ